MIDETLPKRIREYNEAKSLFDQILIENKWDKTEITGRRRNAFIVDKRQIIAKKMRNKGYSYPLIGEIMNRDHTSIMHLCRNRD